MIFRLIQFIFYHILLSEMLWMKRFLTMKIKLIYFFRLLLKL